MALENNYVSEKINKKLFAALGGIEASLIQKNKKNTLNLLPQKQRMLILITLTKKNKNAKNYNQ